MDKRWKYFRRNVFGVTFSSLERIGEEKEGSSTPQNGKQRSFQDFSVFVCSHPKICLLQIKKEEIVTLWIFLSKWERNDEKYEWTILLPKLFETLRRFSSPILSNPKNFFQTSSSLKFFLLVKFVVSRESREKSFAEKQSCPSIPFYSRFSRKNGRDLKDLPLPSLSSLSRHSGSRPPVMQISRRKLKFREVTLPSRLRTRQSRVPSFRFVIEKKKKKKNTVISPFIQRNDTTSSLGRIDQRGVSRAIKEDGTFL